VLAYGKNGVSVCSLTYRLLRICAVAHIVLGCLFTVGAQASPPARIGAACGVVGEAATAGHAGGGDVVCRWARTRLSQEVSSRGVSKCVYKSTHWIRLRSEHAQQNIT
jgi:hypothetical protein